MALDVATTLATILLYLFKATGQESGDMASPSPPPWGPYQPLGRGHSLWALGTGWWDVLSLHHQLRSIYTSTTLPIPLPGTAHGMNGHRGLDQRCQQIKLRKKVEETGQVSSCPSLECPPGSSNQSWDSSAGGCIQATTRTNDKRTQPPGPPRICLILFHSPLTLTCTMPLATNSAI